MVYVAIRGGEAAIAGAARALEELRVAGQEGPLSVQAIAGQLRLLTDRVMAEGGVHHRQLAALAVKQALGDPLEAAFYLRAWRSTRPRLATTSAHSGSDLRLIRRISSTFKDIPGGQMLGPSTDYVQRLFRVELLDENPTAFRAALAGCLPEDVLQHIDGFPQVVDLLREEGLVPAPADHDPEPWDITREPLSFPAPRSAALSTLARGEAGAVLGFAYTAMRGYGDTHPTIAELRVGYLPVKLPHPVTGELIEAGEILITECSIVAMYHGDTDRGGLPVFGLGYGCCLGQNETKAIAMAILDRSLWQKGPGEARQPAEDPEFVLSHVDGIDAYGFCNHYKLPHYVTFQSDLDRLRTTRRKQAAGATADSL